MRRLAVLGLGGLALAVCLTSSASSTIAGAGPMFRAPAYEIGPPGFTRWEAVADLNHDGLSDIVCSLSGAPYSLVIALGSGGGSFAKFRGYFPNHGDYLAEAADFDGDGRLDIGGCERPGGARTASGVLIGFGDGNGGIVDSFEVDLASTPVLARAGDLDLDGRADLVVSLLDSDSVVVYHANANRTLSFVGEYGTLDVPEQTAIGDVTGDGKPDVVVGYRNEAHAISIFPGDGLGGLGARIDVPMSSTGNLIELANMDHQPGLDLVMNRAFTSFARGQGGSFATPVSLAETGGQFGFGPAIGDIDGDGNLDIVAGANANPSRGVQSWRGDGNGGFAGPIVSHATIFAPGEMLLGDFDGDGKLDATFPGSFVPIVLTTRGNGDGSFGISSPAPVAGTLRAAVVGDFDGDGRLDAAASNFTDNTLAFAHGNGDGTLGPITVSAPTPHSYQSLTGGRFDSDAVLDLVGIIASPPTLSFLRGHGDGTFDAPVDFPLDASPRTPALVDLDHDGRMDVVVPCAGAAALDVFLDGPTGLTGSTASPAPAGPLAVRYADLDGDGRLDRVIACTNSIVVQLDDGAGGYATHQTLAETFPLGDLALGDADGDGVPDVMASLASTAPTGGPVAIVHLLRGHPGGTFDSESSVRLDWWQTDTPGVSPPTITSLYALDLDGDGKLDLVARDANNRSSAVVARGHGDGTFDFPEAYSSGFVSGGLAFGDLDGDGRIDMVTTGSSGTSSPLSSLVPLLNQAGEIVAVGQTPAATGTHAELALSRIAPNPNAGHFTFTLTAAQAGTARLALYSPAGREVYARGPVALVAGTNQLALDAAPTRLPAGIYWLRASSGAASAATKVVLLAR